MIECLYFLTTLRSSASTDYNTWRNYLDRWNSKMGTTTSLAKEKLWEHYLMV
jgi:hypothetical protein